MNEKLYETIGLKIKEFRVQNKMTQQDLSEKTNLARSSISNIESGRQKIPIDALYNIAYVLNEEVSALLPKFAELNKNEFIDLKEASINEEEQFLKNILSKFQNKGEDIF